MTPGEARRRMKEIRDKAKAGTATRDDDHEYKRLGWALIAAKAKQEK